MKDLICIYLACVLVHAPVRGAVEEDAVKKSDEGFSGVEDAKESGKNLPVSEYGILPQVPYNSPNYQYGTPGAGGNGYIPPQVPPYYVGYPQYPPYGVNGPFQRPPPNYLQWYDSYYQRSRPYRYW